MKFFTFAAGFSLNSILFKETAQQVKFETMNALGSYRMLTLRARKRSQQKAMFLLCPQLPWRWICYGNSSWRESWWFLGLAIRWLAMHPWCQSYRGSWT